MLNKIYKDLEMELLAKKTWEFTSKIKENIWNDKYEKSIIDSYVYSRNNSTIKFGWQLEAEPILEAFEEVQRNHTFDYLDSYYIQLKFAYNYWKQYEHEWNLKYKNYINND